MQLTSYAMHVFTVLKVTYGLFSSVLRPGGIPFLVLQAGGFLPGSPHLSKAQDPPHRKDWPSEFGYSCF